MVLYRWMDISVEKRLEGILGGIKATFTDNMDQPVHRWFRFPAGFSADLVKSTIQTLGISRKGLVLDPFTGCGTTNVTCKLIKMNSVGVEAHPLLSWIARVKVYWNFDLISLRERMNNKLRQAKAILEDVHPQDYDLDSKPRLLGKCYSRETLGKLYALKEFVEEEEDIHLRELMLLGLLSILRKTTKVASGWPYILPKQRKKNKVPSVYDAFKEQMDMMYGDLRAVIKTTQNSAEATILEGKDARNLNGLIGDEQIDFIFTSPPYLNNYDYADRTRLELYFLGWASTWREITEKVRSKLIISATTQINRSKMMGMKLREELPGRVREELLNATAKLSRIRLHRGGKKDYDLMVIGYFNDMYEAMREMYRVLKPEGYSVMILGDSAPYGVYIPTDIYLAKIGEEIGFKKSKIYVLRERGGKWKYLVEKGIRHNIPLRESMVLFQK